jgi:hypothetical protein
MDTITLHNKLGPSPVAPATTESGLTSQYIGDVDVNSLLNIVDRNKNNTPGDGRNNCGFNAILEQVGDQTHTLEMVNLLRHKLKFNDELSNEMFDGEFCLHVARLFNRPVAEIYGKNNKVVQLLFSIPGPDLIIHFTNKMQLSQNFKEWCEAFEWPLDRVTSLSQWLKANFPGIDKFEKVTIDGILLQLLSYPKTIGVVSDDQSQHFDPAPHGNLQREDNVLKFLDKA